jgi:adenylylsulfate kinase-like enzyme
LYRKARSGDIKDFTGIDSDYEAPADPEIHLEYRDESSEDTALRLYQLLHEKGLV